MYGSAALIAGLGIAGLAGLTFGASAQSRQIAVLVPPWADNGVALAAATGLAIVDLHWQRHVIILDTGGDTTAVARLRAQGLWLLDASGTVFCRTDFKGT